MAVAVVAGFQISRRIGQFKVFLSIVFQKLSLGPESRPVSRLYFPALLGRLNTELPLEYQTEVNSPN